MDTTTAELSALSLDDDRERIVTEEDGHPRTWVNVLKDLEAASEEMELGDLLFGECFDMQDAMSAIEIMDPQMDSGMRLASVQVADEEELLPTLPDLVPAPLMVALLDEVMCAEHGWYRGLSLAQTVYAIEWMQTAPDVAYVPLRAALTATARAVAAARSLVLCGDVHEEEDFSSSVGGVKLHDNVTDTLLVSLLNEADELCAGAVRMAKEALEAKQAKGEEAGAELREVMHAEAVHCRLRYRKGFCGALLHLARKPDAKALGVARRMLSTAETQLDAIERTLDVGTPREDVQWCLAGKAVRKAAGASSTKRAELMARAEAITASRELIGELKSLCTIPESCEDYDGLVRWLEGLVSRVPTGPTAGRPPSILVRSSAQLLCVSESRGGAGLRAPIEAMLAGAIAAFSGLSEPLMRELITLPPVAEFMSQCSQGELARLRTRNINRARARRRLRHYLSDWAPLQDIAESLDMQLQQAGYLQRGVGPFGAWCLHRTLRDMLWCVRAAALPARLHASLPFPPFHPRPLPPLTPPPARPKRTAQVDRSRL
jgi:hypothetical protein